MPAIRHKGVQITDLDRRAARSRRMLWQALLALLQYHDWADISILMICEKADVARSTFYAHFPTKQDLLDAGIADGAAAIAQSMDDTPTLAWLVAHAADSQGFMRRVKGSAAGYAIQARFHAMTQALLRNDLTRLHGAINDADITFIAGGVFATIDAWLAQGCREAEGAMIGRLQGQIGAVLGCECIYSTLPVAFVEEPSANDGATCSSDDKQLASRLQLMQSGK
jgi:AcrR family transcriptional regulator